jgi:regulator of sigma E protease
MSITGLIAIVFTFGVAILAHEFGHFIFAKLLGVGVETFSIGMGKKVIKIKRGETTYCLSSIPFGGYVVLKGAISKEMEAQLRENEEKAKEKKEAGEKDKKSLPEMVSDDILSLRNKPLPVKVAIYASGVFMNFVVAIITFTAIMVIGIDVPVPKPPIVGFVAPATIPEQLGVKQGDRVKAVNGIPVKNFDEIYERLGVLIESKATTLTITLARGEKTFNVGVLINIKSQKFLGFIRNFNPPLSPYIEDVMYNQPADRANIMPGD